MFLSDHLLFVNFRLSLDNVLRRLAFEVSCRPQGTQELLPRYPRAEIRRSDLCLSLLLPHFPWNGFP